MKTLIHRRFILWSILLGWMVLLLLLTTACGERETPAPDGESVSPAQPPFITVSQLLESPGEYEGAVVSTVGQIEEWFEPAVVRLRSCVVLDCRQLLVTGISEEDVEAAIESDLPIRVVGMLRLLPPENLLGEIRPTDPAYLPFVRGPVIEADTVEVLTLDALVGLSNTFLPIIAQDPERFIGREVALQGGIRRVMTDQVFTLMDTTYTAESDELLVLAPTQELIDTPPSEGAPVGTRGTVQWFDAEELAALLDVSAEAFEEYHGKVMIAADSLWIDDEPPLPGSAALSPVLRPASLDHELQLLSVIESPTTFVDQWIVVSGQYVRPVGGFGRVISGLGLAVEHELLVLDPYVQAPYDRLRSGLPVLVGGKVVRFDQSETQEMLDVALDDQAFAPYQNQAILIATRIRPIPESQVQRLRRGVLEMLVKSPDPYIGSQVAVYGQVAESIGTGVFALTTGLFGDEMLILQTEEPDDLAGGDGVTVIGTLVWFEPQELSQKLGLPLTAEAFDRFEGRPVLLAERVHPGSEDEGHE